MKKESKRVIRKRIINREFRKIYIKSLKSNLKHYFLVLCILCISIMLYRTRTDLRFLQTILNIILVLTICGLTTILFTAVESLLIFKRTINVSDINKEVMQEFYAQRGNTYGMVNIEIKEDENQIKPHFTNIHVTVKDVSLLTESTSIKYLDIKRNYSAKWNFGNDN